jgi:hypothetical protein
MVHMILIPTVYPSAAADRVSRKASACNSAMRLSVARRTTVPPEFPALNRSSRWLLHRGGAGKPPFAVQ